MKNRKLSTFVRGGWISTWAGLGYFVFLCAWAPLGTVFQFGGDEGFELIKGYLCGLGYVLYGDIWNDQPPLHTGLLCLLFKFFGPSLLAARVLAALFGGVMAGTLYELGRQSAGHLGGTTALGVLLAWPSFMTLSVSVMLEPAMMAMALVSTRLLIASVNSAGRDYRLWLGLSGLGMGLALQTKLTAALFVPAMFVQLLLACWSCGKLGDSLGDNGRLRQAINAIALWIVTILIGILAVWLFFPAQSVDGLLRSHFSTETQTALGDSSGVAFTGKVLWRAWDFLTVACGGALWIFLRKKWDELLPVVLLGTVLVVHAFHRPYWSYYGIHFAAPIAWLSGILTGELWRWINASIRQARERQPGKRVSFGGRVRSVQWFAGAFAWSLAVSLVATGVVIGLPQAMRSVRRHQTVADVENVARLKRFAGDSVWVFTDAPIFAFYAAKPIPPWLAVVPRKRWWSGQIRWADHQQILEEYMPDTIYLHRSESKAELAGFLDRYYEETEVRGIYVKTSRRRGPNLRERKSD